MATAHELVGKKEEVVYVAESPPPSKQMTSPFQPTPKIATRLRKALRAGSARACVHEKRTCRAYSPRTLNDSGIMVGMHPSKMRIEGLRALIASMVHDMYIKGEVCHHCDVRVATSGAYPKYVIKLISNHYTFSSS